MGAELLVGLAPDHLVLGAVLVLMGLEAAGAPPRWARRVLAGALVAALAVLLQQLAGGYAAVLLAGELAVDRGALLAKAVCVGCGLALAAGFPRAWDYKAALLAAAAVFGAMVMMSSQGFATLFLGLELLSLPAFALIVHGRGPGPAGEAAFKYLLLSSVATAILLFGASLAYGSRGDLGLAGFAAAAARGGALDTAALLLVLAGLMTKAAVFPFHAWAPDAYAGARLPVTALLASLVKVAVVLALVRVLGGTVLAADLRVVLAALAIGSILYGNLAALAQRSMRRMLAYSSVAHAGYMLFALVDTTGGRELDLLWYAAIYAAGTIAACAAYAALAGDGPDDALARLDGMAAARPGAALLLAAALLSLAGLPPLPGFFAKLRVFQSVVASGELLPAILAFAGSFIGLAYYLRIVLGLFRTDLAPSGLPAGRDDRRAA